MRQLASNAFCTEYEVSLYFSQTKPVLKCYKISKYNIQYRTNTKYYNDAFTQIKGINSMHISNFFIISCISN